MSRNAIVFYAGWAIALGAVLGVAGLLAVVFGYRSFRRAKHVGSAIRSTTKDAAERTVAAIRGKVEAAPSGPLATPAGNEAAVWYRVIVTGTEMRYSPAKKRSQRRTVVLSDFSAGTEFFLTDGSGPPARVEGADAVAVLAQSAHVASPRAFLEKQGLPRDGDVEECYVAPGATITVVGSVEREPAEPDNTSYRSVATTRAVLRRGARPTDELVLLDVDPTTAARNLGRAVRVGRVLAILGALVAALGTIAFKLADALASR